MRVRAVILFICLGLTGQLECISTASGQDTVIVFAPPQQYFHEVSAGLREEVTDEMRIVQQPINAGVNLQSMARAINLHRPRAVVLMDISSIQLYEQFLREDNKQQQLPAVALMTPLVDKAIKKLGHAMAIRYEIPSITAISALSQLSPNPIRRIGVVHRKLMAEFVEQERHLLEREGFSLYAEALPDQMSHPNRRITRALRRLEDKHIDALLV